MSLNIDPSLERPPERDSGELRENYTKRYMEWEASPAGQVWAAALAVANAEWGATELRRAQRRVIDGLNLPIKDVDIFAGGQLRATPSIKAVRESAATILVLAGPVGVGKTVAGSWWLWDFVHKPDNWRGRDDWWDFLPKKKPVFTTAAELARASRYEDEAMDKLLTSPRLVIDDLGSEYSDAKGFFRSLLDEVVNVRYCMRRPLLITTNISAEMFAERYGERTVDRLREFGEFVGIAGPSMRRKQP